MTQATRHTDAARSMLHRAGISDRDAADLLGTRPDVVSNTGVSAGAVDSELGMVVRDLGLVKSFSGSPGERRFLQLVVARRTVRMAALCAEGHRLGIFRNVSGPFVLGSPRHPDSAADDLRAHARAALADGDHDGLWASIAPNAQLMTDGWPIRAWSYASFVDKPTIEWLIVKRWLAARSGAENLARARILAPQEAFLQLVRMKPSTERRPDFAAYIAELHVGLAMAEWRRAAEIFALVRVGLTLRLCRPGEPMPAVWGIWKDDGGVPPDAPDAVERWLVDRANFLHGPGWLESQAPTPRDTRQIVEDDLETFLNASVAEPEGLVARLRRQIDRHRQIWRC